MRAAVGRRRWVGWALRVLGPVILALLLLRLDRPGEVLAAARRSDGWLLGAALLLNLAPLGLKVWRWQIILRARGIEYRWWPAALAFSSSLYLGMLTPGRVGDVLRIQYLRRETGARYAEGLASVVVDRLADLYVLAVFVAVAVVQWGAALSPSLARLSWLAVAASVLAPLGLLVPGVADRALRRIYQRAAARPDADGADAFLSALRGATRRGALPVLALTFASFAVNFLQGKLVADAMGLELGFFEVVSLQAIQSMLGLLPISVSGLGVREAFFAAVFPSLGHAAEEGTSYGLVLFLVMYVSQVLLGAIAWQKNPPPVGEPLVTPPGAD